MNHTPGPWFVFGNGASVGGGHPTVGDESSGLASTATKRRPVEEQKANARLIAAAPDLLDACREADGFLSQLVLDGGEYVPLSQRLGMIGGGLTHKKLKDAISKSE